MSDKVEERNAEVLTDKPDTIPLLPTVTLADSPSEQVIQSAAPSAKQKKEKSPKKPYVKGKPKKKRLTQYQATYLKALLDGHNASDAGRIAYPNSAYPRIQAYKNLRNPDVRGALMEKLEEINYKEKIKDTLNQAYSFVGNNLNEDLSIMDRKLKANDQIAKLVGLYAPTTSQTLSAKVQLRPERTRGR